MKYTVTEKQNLQSMRDGKAIEAKNLTEAKRKASKMQFFCGTVMCISDDSGLVAYKKNDVWHDA